MCNVLKRNCTENICFWISNCNKPTTKHLNCFISWTVLQFISNEKATLLFEQFSISGLLKLFHSTVLYAFMSQLIAENNKTAHKHDDTFIVAENATA